MFSSMLLNVLKWLTHLREGQMMSVVNLKLSSLDDDLSFAVPLNDLTAENKIQPVTGTDQENLLSFFLFFKA